MIEELADEPLVGGPPLLVGVGERDETGVVDLTGEGNQLVNRLRRVSILFLEQGLVVVEDEGFDLIGDRVELAVDLARLSAQGRNSCPSHLGQRSRQGRGVCPALASSKANDGPGVVTMSGRRRPRERCGRHPNRCLERRFDWGPPCALKGSIAVLTTQSATSEPPVVSNRHLELRLVLSGGRGDATEPVTAGIRSTTERRASSGTTVSENASFLPPRSVSSRSERTLRSA